MQIPRSYRSSVLAVLASVATLAACDDSTGTLTPAERADAIRTLVDLTNVPDRVLRAGHTVRVGAFVTDEFNDPLGGVPIIFSTLGGGLVSADSGFTGTNGLLGAQWTLGTAAGAQELVATVDGGTGILDRYTAFVYPDTIVGTLDLVAQGDSLAAGAEMLVRVASATDQYGNQYALFGSSPLNPPAIEFASLDPDIATLTSTTARSAVVKGLADGSARIEARSDGKADTVTVQVVTLTQN